MAGIWKYLVDNITLSIFFGVRKVGIDFSFLGLFLFSLWFWLIRKIFALCWNFLLFHIDRLISLFDFHRLYLLLWFLKLYRFIKYLRLYFWNILMVGNDWKLFMKWIISRWWWWRRRIRIILIWVIGVHSLVVTINKPIIHKSRSNSYIKIWGSKVF